MQIKNDRTILTEIEKNDNHGTTLLYFGRSSTQGFHVLVDKIYLFFIFTIILVQYHTIPKKIRIYSISSTRKTNNENNQE
mmetsp:Transcript_17184/g.19380  ORF Transcript_17184/g.19380 Transcript_17184/m.19380 type:complete len:80 (+) Transcript_17184:1183-1422(+)